MLLAVVWQTEQNGTSLSESWEIACALLRKEELLAAQYNKGLKSLKKKFHNVELSKEVEFCLRLIRDFSVLLPEHEGAEFQLIL